MARRCTRVSVVGAGALALACLLGVAHLQAHHSFAMYDQEKTYVFTGVVTRVTPDVSHLQIFFVPLNDRRDAVVRDASGEPIVWTVELRGAATVAREGVTLESFPPGTIFSIGLHPLRNGQPAGSREGGLFKCPVRTPPAPGKHCDSVEGHTAIGKEPLPTPTK